MFPSENPAPARPYVAGAAFVVAVALLSVSCARQPLAAPTGQVDRKMSLSSYIEEGQLLALVVSTRVTRLRGDRKYIPLEIAVVNKGMRSLTVNRENLTLVDDNGRRYPAVSRRELSKGYGSADSDRALGELPLWVNSWFSGFAPSPGVLTPTFDRPIAIDFRLPRFTYAIDFLYYPMPEGGIENRKFELVLDSRELEEPVFVRFVVRTGKP